jgi:hypothetical protein
MNFHKKEKGQSLLILAFVIFAGVVMLVLVVDGGMLLMNRRRAQTAADAGAYAGAYYKCKHEGATNQEIADKATEYARAHNGADQVTVSFNGDEIVVETWIQASTFFGNIINRSQTEAYAIAAAHCATPEGAHVLPIAFACKGPADEGGEDPTNPGTEFICPLEMVSEEYALNHYNNIAPDNFDPHLYIVMEAKKMTDEYICEPDGELVCDIDGDGDDEIMANGDRGWLDLDGDAASASELVDWIENGFDGDIFVHTWFPLNGGNVTSAYQASADLVGQLVYVPIVDAVCLDEPTGIHPDDPCVKAAHCQYCDDPDACDCELPYDGNDMVISTSGTGAQYVHMVGVAAYFVTCVDAGPVSKNECPGHNKAVDVGTIKQNDNTIEGFFIGGEIITGDISSTIGMDTGVYTINLTR